MQTEHKLRESDEIGKWEQKMKANGTYTKYEKVTQNDYIKL